MAIVGKSGSGKSTLLNMVGGIDRPTSGAVNVGGNAIEGMSENQLALWRGRHVGLVFQFFQLLPTLTVAENVMLPMDFCRTFPPAERRGARARPARPGRRRGPGGQASLRPFGRPAAAGRHRPGPRQRAAGDPRRRADRQSRFHHRARRPRPASAAWRAAGRRWSSRPTSATSRASSIEPFTSRTAWWSGDDTRCARSCATSGRSGPARSSSSWPSPWASPPSPRCFRATRSSIAS